MNYSLNNPAQVLEEKSQQGWSGCLVILEPQDSAGEWKIYFHEGKIQYAASTVAQKERLACLWQQIQPNLIFPETSTKPLNYSELYEWSLKQEYPKADLKKLLFELSKEALNQVLSLDKAQIQANSDRLSGTPVGLFLYQDLIEQELIETWKTIRTYLYSSLSILYLPQEKAFNFYKSWKSLAQNNSSFESFAAAQKISDFVNPLFEKIKFYEFANKCNLTPIILAQYLQSFIQEGLIQVVSSGQTTNSIASNSKISQSVITQPTQQLQKPEKTSNIATNQTAKNLPMIACVDDSKTVQTQVQMTLQSAGYQVISVTEASKALRELSRQMPILILMDINMPEINGYDLCSMLRRSQKFQNIPIVMLTGRDGMFDRMRAKLVGANNYLTKPFQPQELIDVIRENTLSLATDK